MARRRGVGPDVRQVVVAYQRTIQVFTDAGELASAAAGALRAAGRSLLNYDLTQLLAFRDEMSAFAVARIRATVALQGPQVIRVTKLGSHMFEEAPVMLRALDAHLTIEVGVQVGDDTVVVEQRVVHVEQERGVGPECAHRMILCAAVSCRRTPDLPAAVIVVSAGLVHESYVMEDDPNDDTLFNGRR
jgi:hypothetical protein